MLNRRLPRLAASLLSLAFTAAALGQTAAHTFTSDEHQFLMDGKPYQIISGEMHYPRVPRAYWRDRFEKARAMGLNTITTYVFWNVHEPRPGVFDFSGQNDVAEYIREAQSEGLNVILRPGPYVCAEWELGGYPSWLLKNKNLVLRSTDPAYTAAVHTWFQRLGKEINPLLLKNGGPIIAVQLENEYGSFGDDKAYLEGLKKELISSGMGDGLLYTADGPNQLRRGSLPELPAVINFGSGDFVQSAATYNKLRPDGPRMVGEWWTGWFDHWGEQHHKTNPATEAAELKSMLEQGYSVSMYMFHGGTSFGWMNGANSNGKNYQPDTTSYDYDAPLSENGDPGPKYALFRRAIADATHTTPPDIALASARATFPVSDKQLSASLWDNLPKPTYSPAPLSFEELGQAYGYVLYQIDLPSGAGKLSIAGLHDYAQVFIDHKLVGSLDRRLGTNSLDLPPHARGAKLNILVENSGRVNFTDVIRTERKGLLGAVKIGDMPIHGWQMYSLPMSDFSEVHFEAKPCEGPCFFRTTMQVSQPADTYIDTSALHKGVLWLGDIALGRFWSIGPQYALYTPGPWLHKGDNTITYFDLLGDSTDKLKTRPEPDIRGDRAIRD